MTKNHLPLDKAIVLDETLKKAGVEMETEYGYPTNGLTDRPMSGDPIKKSHYPSLATFPAPTLSEMIELLPKNIKIYKLNIDFYEGWYVAYVHPDEHPTDDMYVGWSTKQENSTLLEAVYEALLWCLGEGYVKDKK